MTFKGSNGKQHKHSNAGQWQQGCSAVAAALHQVVVMN